MKTIAIYLPQFHNIPENDLWWGKGYTEWIAVQKARPLFAGHYQPHIPLDRNYYDLLSDKTLIWQADLMKTYQIDAMCFYHYYFKDSKMVLEKPAEILLQNKKIDMPFCFSWANESWIRTWSGISGNTWNMVEEGLSNNRMDNGVLLAQGYGDEAEWRNHFMYLTPFFLDDRYIKIDERPIFIIYKPEEITCFSRMKECWNSLSREMGMNEVFFIGVNSFRPDYDAYLIQEPGFSCTFGEDGMGWEKYEDACDEVLRDAVKADKMTFLCGMVSYDDTPRRGKDGTVLTDSSPEQFYDLMRKLYFLSEKQNKEFIFVNAWNEWGEGMHLEPDEKNGYGYLEALKRARNNYNELINIDQFCAISKDNDYLRKDQNEEMLKYKSHYYLTNKWLSIKEQSGDLLPFFLDNKLNTVAVYGIGFLGKHLLKELNSIGINISYAVDKSLKSFQGLDVYSLKDVLPASDAIIVTPIDEYYDIRDELKKITDIPIISLEEIIDYCLIN